MAGIGTALAAACWHGHREAGSWRAAAALRLTTALPLLPHPHTQTQDLVDGLVQLGVKASCTMGTGCPPVEVIAEGLPSGKVSLSGSVSSQYLTALLMAAPLATGTGARGCGGCRGAAAEGLLVWASCRVLPGRLLLPCCCCMHACARRRLRIRNIN